MATKKQEREALEKIMNIIESVGGDDSYIGKAFEGCYLLAQSNIDNDYKESMKSRVASKHDELLKTEVKLYQKSEELEKAERDLTNLQIDLDDANFQLNSALESKRCLWNSYIESEENLKSTKDELADAKREITELKAKLYDLLCK